MQTLLGENNSLAMGQVAQAQRIKNYSTGIHNVLNRPDFTVNDDTFKTAKIVLRSIDNIVDFLSGYICGNPVSISSDDESAGTMAQSVFKKGFYQKVDFEIAKNLVMYGNSYEYVFKDNGVIKSKVINNTDSYPVYEDGAYTRFIEKYCINPLTDDVFEREYTPTTVSEYKNGVLQRTYRNTTGLPIHYTSGDLDRTNIFGQGTVGKLIPIMDEIEQLLSKMYDSVNTLSLNPLLSVSGQRIDENTDANTTGQTVNLEDGSEMKYVVSNLDYQSIKLILDNLIQQFYTIANVPSALFDSGNIANVSETSLSLLFNNTSNFAKRIGLNMQVGFLNRLQYWSKLLKMDVTACDITFNFNAPTDYKSMMESMQIQFNCGAISRESIIRNSPYTSNVSREIALIDKSSVK
jgi:SPP1 family phage portal protein